MGHPYKWRSAGDDYKYESGLYALIFGSKLENAKQFLMLEVSDSQNGNLVKTAMINESGLYALIFDSKLESANKFKHWVTSEILPTIRKTGGYINNDSLSS